MAETPILGRGSLNENEQRVLTGFILEAPIPETAYDLIQVQVPIGIRRLEATTDQSYDLDRTIASALSSRPGTELPRGFFNEKELSDREGSHTASYTGKADVVMVTSTTVYLVEIKTQDEGIDGLHDIYEGFGQILINRDQFLEDYPTVGSDRKIETILLVENISIEPERIRPSFEERDVILFDPVRGGELVGGF